MSLNSALYRLRVAQGFLAEAQQDIQLGRWRSAVDNAQLAVESAAKAVLALVAPVGKTHNPAPLLREAIAASRFPAALAKKVERIAECAEQLGFDIHIQTDYGDEMAGRTPWELFDESDARQALELAEEALALAEDIIQEVQDES